MIETYDTNFVGSDESILESDSESALGRADAAPQESPRSLSGGTGRSPADLCANILERLSPAARDLRRTLRPPVNLLPRAGMAFSTRPSGMGIRRGGNGKSETDFGGAAHLNGE